MRYLTLIPILMLLFYEQANAQGCGCTNCPQVMPDRFVGDFFFTVTGADSNDLSSPNQGICGVNLNFSHQYLGDLEIILTSPSGEQIVLVGPIGISGTTDNSSWDVSFVPCGDVAAPDPGSGATWNNSNFLVDGNYTGSYYPHMGCLEDFDVGSVNGTWTLTVTDDQFLDTGLLIDYSIEFCDTTGIRCLSCNTSRSQIGERNIQACEGSDSLLLTLTTTLIDSVPDSLDYDYTYVLTAQDTIRAYLDSVDLRNYPPDKYVIYGLQYHIDNADILPPIDTADIRTVKMELDSGIANFCGRVSLDSICITIFDVPDTVFVFDTICNGDLSIVVNDSQYVNAGVYPIQLLTSQGCDSSIIFSLTVLEHPVTQLSDTLCQGESLQVGDSLLTQSGFYNIRLFGEAANGCDSIVEVDLSIISNSITILPPDTINCIMPTTVIDASASVHGPNATFEWQYLDIGFGIVSGAATKTPIVQLPGRYVFTLTEASASGRAPCILRDTIEVFTNAVVPIANAGDDRLLNCDMPTTILDGAFSSQGPDIVYSWSGPMGFMAFEISTTVNDSGVYVLTVFDTVSRCQSTDTVRVNADFEIPDVAATGGVLTCIIDTVFLTVDNPAANVSYRWTNASGFDETGNPVATMQPGDYTLTAVGNNGCQDSALVSVTVNRQAPVVGIRPANLSCNNPDGDHTIISAPGNYNYEWSDTSGVVLSNNDFLNVTDTALYYLEVTDTDNGCVYTDSVRATRSFGVPGVMVDTPAILTCIVNSVQLNGQIGDTSNLQWQWEDANQLVIANTLSASVSDTGQYFFRVTNTSNGCETLIGIQVIEDREEPIINAQALDTLRCNMPTARLRVSYTASDSVSIRWFLPNGMPFSTDSLTTTFIDGLHRVEVTNVTNGCRAQANVNVLIDTMRPAALILPTDTLTCNLLEVLLQTNAEQGVEYNWLFGNTVFANDTNRVVVSVPGTYVLEAIQSRNGCRNLDSIQVVINRDTPMVMANVNDTLSCDVQQVLISASPDSTAYRYEWYSGGMLFSTSASALVLEPGIYTLIYTDISNGCQGTDSILVIQDTLRPNVSIAGDDEINCLQDSIQLTASVNGGRNSYRFIWNLPLGGQLTQQSITIGDSGLYQLIVTDTLNGCSAFATKTITENRRPPDVAIQGAQDLTCTDTSIWLTSLGSDAGVDFSYQWLNQQNQVLGNGDSILVATPQDYSLIVTDGRNGCTAIATITIGIDTLHPEIIIPLLHPPTLTCDRTEFTLDASGSLPNSSVLFYDWSLPKGTSTASSISVDEAGIYQLRIENQNNGCPDTITIEVILDNEVPNAVLNDPDTLTCIRDEVNLIAILQQADPDIRFFWNAPSGSPFPDTSSIITTEGGLHSVRLFNSRNACEATVTVSVPIDTAEPTVSVQAEQQLTCSVQEVTLRSEGSSEGPQFTYAWSASAGGSLVGAVDQLQAVAASAGTYQLLILNQINGCSEVASVAVNEEIDRPRSAVLNVSSPSCFDQQDGFIRILEVVGGVGPYSYFFNQLGPFEDPIFTQNLTEGQYSIGIEDANECRWDTTIDLTIPDPLTADLGAELFIENGDVVELALITSRPVASAEWITPIGFDCDPLQQICRDTPAISTLYQVVVSDTNGCTAEASKWVYVKTIRRVFAPNIFSPNDDGKNDFFYLTLGKGTREIRVLHIFDRWGECIYQQEDIKATNGNGKPSIAWDGSFRGQKALPGVYVFIAEIEYDDGRIDLIKGSVTLVR